MNKPLLVTLVCTLGCQSDINLIPDSSLTSTPNPPDLSAVTKEDRIVQVTVPSVDVLWLIDNSCSMIEEQIALTDNFGKFIQYFVGSGLDYHIGVVSTDWEDDAQQGKLQGSGGLKWIDDQVTNPVQVFGDMAVLGTYGSAYEKGRAQVYGALDLNRDTDNAGFYRDEAYLMVVAISDEDDSSGVVGAYDYSNIPDIPAIVEPVAFADWMKGLKKNEEMVSFSSIVGPESGCSTAIEPGTEYLEVTRLVGGIEWSICDPNWDQVLEELGMQAAGLKREFFLTEVPVAETIAVRVVNDEDELLLEEGVDWEYFRSRNSIQFYTFVPDPLTEIFISYDVLAGEKVGASEEETEG